ncbi:MAG TPA: trypsin-like peptidase domain-containing protein [Anaerolineae bacterium]|nr:trypsin-like peptidase domain-containing protein [Anaerolineae bacterium]
MQKRSRSGFWVGLIIGSVLIAMIICFVFIYIGVKEPEVELAETTPAFNRDTPESKSLAQASPMVSQVTSAPLPSSEYPAQAVVQIIVAGKVEGKAEEWSGSGTIISPDGLILTNAHVAIGDKFYQAEELLIAMTEAEDIPPKLMYYAEVVQADTGLDLAVLRITSDLHGKHVNSGALNLPYVAVGNSDELRLGDKISILGYPDIGGKTITLTSGEVSGFTAETGYGNRAYIKTSATISGGNSGGLVTNERMELIGVPTQLGAGDEEVDIVDCRRLADTNRDGYIDEYDSCIPTGGFINALRPVNLALPLIEAAQRGEVAFVEPSKPGIAVPAGGTIIFQDDFSDPSTGWPTISDNTGSVGYSNGTYEIDVHKTEYMKWVLGGVNYRDLIIAVKTKVINSVGNGDYGLVCRYVNNENFYMLEITEDAYYSIFKYQQGERVTILDWQFSVELQDLTSADIEVMCIGDTLTIIVNGKALGQASDTSFSRGDYGILVGTWDTAGFKVAFDDLIVQQP